VKGAEWQFLNDLEFGSVAKHRKQERPAFLCGGLSYGYHRGFPDARCTVGLVRVRDHFVGSANFHSMAR
jgi:hypothetical protein